MTVTANDGHGGIATTTFSLVVLNLEPTITSLTSSAADLAHAAVNGEVSLQTAFADAGVTDAHHAVIDWGDGTQAALVDNDAGINQSARTLSVNHAYAAGGVYTVTLTLIDDDGSVASSL